MRALKAWLDLCRVSNLPTVWTNVLAASVLASGAFPAGPFLLLALALSCFYLAGMSLNDLCDLEHDRRHRPDRPLPSGRVSPRGALVLTLALFAAGLGLLALAPDPLGLAAGLLLILAIVAYDLRHKGNPLSVLIMAACRLLVFVVVALALTGQVPALVWLAGALQFAWVVLVSLTARYENRRAAPWPFPVIPAMLAGIALLDGIVLAILVAPPWLAAGLAGAALTWAGQRFVRGD
ncbi:MAG: UbiA family prenyltransferase [Thiobacillaceae bacterium]|jgi:4-hydroxybenzoate polyprenyltransferase|nr:UbiA family prenyltransferase [Thiobacillaceae bacterium]